MLSALPLCKRLQCGRGVVSPQSSRQPQLHKRGPEQMRIGEALLIISRLEWLFLTVGGMNFNCTWWPLLGFSAGVAVITV